MVWPVQPQHQVSSPKPGVLPTINYRLESNLTHQSGVQQIRLFINILVIYTNLFAIYIEGKYDLTAAKKS